MRMCLAILPLSVACLALFLSSVTNADPLKVMSAPNLLRIGATENIFVECQGCSGDNLNIEIFVKNYPTETIQIAYTTMTLTKRNNFQDFAEIKIPADTFEDDPELKQHVSLEAKFSDGTSLKKVVLVSLQSGYIFIQTDKPLYTPDSKVRYRMFAVTPGMKPIQNDDQASIININIVTPDGIVFPEDPVSLKSGLHSGIYHLPEIVSSGLWKVVASFQNNKHHNYSTEFEVKEYVLPSFEVKITTDKKFFHVDDEILTIDIQATYLFGKQVTGAAFVVFGIFDQNKEKHSLSSSFKHVAVVNGHATATLNKQDILKTYDKIKTLVKSSIYVSVSVLTQSGSEMVEAEKQGIHIVESPYTIHLKNTPKYFKPAMFFEVVACVENPDGSPAADIPILVGPGDYQGLTDENGFARVFVMPAGNLQHLQVVATTDHPQTPDNQEASASMTVLAYNSNIKSYLQIGLGTAKVHLGVSQSIIFHLSAPIAKRHLTYLIQSRGQLVKHGHFNTMSLSIHMTLQITKELLPSFRIIAYYRDRGEVVSDSVWVDVADTCMGSLKLESNNPVLEPRQKFSYKITGDPGAKVGLVAVDKGVYALNNKHHLTQKKVWDIVEKADTGCTVGGGKNGMNVFYDAGLLFQSVTIGTDDRLEFKCPDSTRTKRSPAILDVRSSLLSEYNNTLERQCCLDGMVEIPLSYSCERRKEYISDGEACSDAFLKCCQELTKLRTELTTEAFHLARSLENNHFSGRNIYIRSKFKESMLWQEYTLPLCKTPNCKTGDLEETAVLQDSITTWHLTGISLSPTNGICIDDTLTLIVRKDFFIDLKLPYSAVLGEQIEIKAILHNYLLDEITVWVELKEALLVCSSASNKGAYTQKVTVGRSSTLSIPFIIIPMEVQSIPIVVKAFSDNRQDAIQRILKVVPRGVLVKKKVVKRLSPADYQGRQVVTIINEVDEEHVDLKNARTEISVARGVQTLVEKVLDGSYMQNLIIVPSGCGEQNLAAMTLPITAVMYLDKTYQWDKVGASKRDKALRHINAGYRTQLTHRKADGSFAIFPWSGSSSWLTSYTAKVFAMAYNVTEIEPEHICEAIYWVIVNSQMLNGSFVDVGFVHDKRMMGGMGSMDSDASRTAFSLIAMQESHYLCKNTINVMQRSMNKAVDYLESRLPNLNNAYAVAMVSYALAVANKNKFNKRILYRFASPDNTHWPVENQHLITLEATAYALLALVKVKELNDAARIVGWLETQDNTVGNTQSTTMVYQAVAEYWVHAQKISEKMIVDIEIPGRTKSTTVEVNTDSDFRTSATTIKDLNQEFKVTATGTGEATITVVSLYYQLPTTTNISNNCEKFELNVDFKTEIMDTDGNTYKLKMEILYRDPKIDAGMTILDIGLLTGHIADVEDLKKLSRGVDRTILNYEMNKLLSDKGSLILYLDSVSHTQRQEVAFKIKDTMKVGVLQPASVSVYEYYHPKTCTKFYHPARIQGQMLKICQGDVCQCAEENCSMQKKDKIDNNERHAKACQADKKIDYVYKVTMESNSDSESTDAYMMQINEVIKLGSLDQVAEDNLRTFVGYSNCREALNLITNKSYLIMGTLKNTHKIKKEREKYEYLLGEETWIEYWPTETECQEQKYGPTCQGLDAFTFKFQLKGCNE